MQRIFKNKCIQNQQEGVKGKRLGREIGRREGKVEMERVTGGRKKVREKEREGEREQQWGKLLEDKSTIFIEYLLSKQDAFTHSLFYRKSLLILNDQIQLSILH